MYLYICGSVGGRSGSLVPFGAKLWEAVTLYRRRGTRPKSLMWRYLSASYFESLNQNTNVCAIRV